jgi:hypothetical protein
MTGKIDIENDNLVFTLTGIDKVLALKSKLTIPLNHVKSVSTAKADWNYFKMLKVVGTRVPEILIDGIFVSKEGFLFYEMHDPNKCITVELENEKYKKVVFQVSDKKSTEKIIQDALDRLQ